MGFKTGGRMNKREFTKRLIGLFADKTSCGIQFSNCPCNSCFHNIEADFNHICWLIVLGLRGDYEGEQILKDISKELKGGLKWKN